MKQLQNIGKQSFPSARNASISERSIRRIDPLALAKVLSVISAILYLLSGIVLVIASYVTPLLSLPANPAVFIAGTTLYGLVGGFLAGFLGASLYNWLSKYIGQIKLEVE